MTLIGTTPSGIPLIGDLHITSATVHGGITDIAIIHHFIMPDILITMGLMETITIMVDVTAITEDHLHLVLHDVDLMALILT